MTIPFNNEGIMLKTFLLTAALFSAATTAAYSGATGFREIAVPGADRPLSAALWYPTNDDGKTESVGENVVFLGTSAVRNAALDGKRHPLVVLSHGYRGSWRNLGWLAGELAARGYVVATVDHPGTTTFNHSSAQAARLSERPHDLSRLIDALVADREVGDGIDTGRIAAIGHSLGGWTVMALAGARVDTERLAADCKVNTSPRACDLSGELGLDPTSAERDRIEGDLHDPRIRAVVSLDLGLARSFTPESLAALHSPVLVIAAGIDIGDMPADLESGTLARGLPKASSDYVLIPDAMHFSFLQICKPGAAALIEADTPGDGIVCEDLGKRTRAEIHSEVTDRVVSFLGKALP
jgi:predicted dienelactone hydrolase